MWLLAPGLQYARSLQRARAVGVLLSGCTLCGQTFAAGAFDTPCLAELRDRGAAVPPPPPPLGRVGLGGGVEYDGGWAGRQPPAGAAAAASYRQWRRRERAPC